MTSGRNPTDLKEPTNFTAVSGTAHQGGHSRVTGGQEREGSILPISPLAPDWTAPQDSPTLTHDNNMFNPQAQGSLPPNDKLQTCRDLLFKLPNRCSNVTIAKSLGQMILFSFG